VYFSKSLRSKAAKLLIVSERLWHAKLVQTLSITAVSMLGMRLHVMAGGMKDWCLFVVQHSFTTKLFCISGLLQGTMASSFWVDGVVFFGVFQGRNTFPIRLPSQHMASWLRIVLCWWIGFVSFRPTVLPQCMNWGEVTIVPLFCATFNYHILYFSCCCHFWIYINNGSICHILFWLRCSTETTSWHTKNGPLMFALLDWNCACRNIFNISNTKD